MASRWRLIAGVAAGGALAAATAWAVREVVEQFGERRRLDDDPRVAGSPQFRNGVFHNTVPAALVPPGAAGRIAREMLFGKQKRRPTGAVPLRTTDIDPPDPDGRIVRLTPRSCPPTGGPTPCTSCSPSTRSRRRSRW